MAANRFHYYDHERCAFVEVAPPRAWRRRLAVAAGVVVLAGAGFGLRASLSTSPAEVAQHAEIEALRAHLDEANERLSAYSRELSELAEADRELYRTVLQAEPIPAEQFAMGAGGSPRDRFGRFSAPTAALLRRTSATIERVEGQVALQARSYDELRRLAAAREGTLRHQPAILPVVQGRLTSGYGMRFHPILHVHRMHTGVDFAVPVGTPVVSTADGVVRFMGTRGGYGLTVEVAHASAGTFTRYAHLSRAADGLREGVPVRRGQVLAYSGNSGMSTGPHLHYEVRRLDAAETPLNPVQTFVPGVTPGQYRALAAAARAETPSFD